MKLNIFYSWQSDLPNNTNRGFIEDCLEKSLKTIYEKNNCLSEWISESDSRDESGTPDIVNSIFSKIDRCDIFICDISIINQNTNFRKTSNPNVLIELGYASNVIGWKNIICVFNDDYGVKEELPFDIRFRKPLGYSTTKDKTEAKKKLLSLLGRSIQEIIDNRLNNKRFYNSIKREVDLSLQAILFDFLKILYFTDSNNDRRLDYNRLLHLTVGEIRGNKGVRNLFLDNLSISRYFLFLCLVQSDNVMVVSRAHLFSSGKFRYANSPNSSLPFLS